MRRKLHIATVSRILVSLGLTLGLQGATLRVDPENGPFITIQDGVDAASPGDTISVAPGEYRQSTIFEFDEFQAPGETFLGIATDSLTIIGDGRDAVIIGPAVPNFVGDLPKGIATRHPRIARLTVRNVTVENARDGAWVQGQTVLDNVVFRSCGLAVLASLTNGFRLENSEVHNSSITGAVTVDRSSGGLVANTLFEGNWSLSVGVGSSNAIDVRDCLFKDGGGLQYQADSSGETLRCHFENLHSRPVTVLSNSSLILRDSRMSGSTGSVSVGGTSSLEATGNVFASIHPINANIHLAGSPTVVLNENDIHLTPGATVRLDGYSSPPAVQLDFTNNYWTTSDEAVIAEEIWDGNDDPAINAIVNFQPIRHSTVKVEKTSFGRFRSKFE